MKKATKVTRKRMTKEKYKAVKTAFDFRGKSVSIGMAARAFGVSPATAQRIAATKNFTEYQQLVRKHSKPNKTVVQPEAETIVCEDKQLDTDIAVRATETMSNETAEYLINALNHATEALNSLASKIDQKKIKRLFR